MTEQQIIQALINKDKDVTEDFFFRRCRPLFLSVIRSVFDTIPVEYDECINSLYTLLMQNDARKLKSFKGESTIYNWLKTVTIRHFVAMKKEKVGDLLVENDSNQIIASSVEDAAEDRDIARSSAHADVERLINAMKNDRYRKVIRRSMLDEVEDAELAIEMGIRVENLYNIKRRAMAQLIQVSQKDILHYGKR